MPQLYCDSNSCGECLYFGHSPAGNSSHASNTAYYLETEITDGSIAPNILENSRHVQAVSLGNVLQAVFYSSEAKVSLGDNNVLGVSAPCFVLLRELAGKLEITVCDGLQDIALKEITVFYAGGEYCIRLPEGLMTGAPVKAVFPR